MKPKLLVASTILIVLIVTAILWTRMSLTQGHVPVQPSIPSDDGPARPQISSAQPNSEQTQNPSPPPMPNAALILEKTKTKPFLEDRTDGPLTQTDVSPNFLIKEDLPCQSYPDSRLDSEGGPVKEYIIDDIQWIDDSKIVTISEYLGSQVLHLRVAFRVFSQNEFLCSPQIYQPLEVKDHILIRTPSQALASVSSQPILEDHAQIDMCESKKSFIQYVLQCPFESFVDEIQNGQIKEHALITELKKLQYCYPKIVHALAKGYFEIAFEEWAYKCNPDHIFESFNIKQRLKSNHAQVVDDTLKYCQKYANRCDWNEELLARLESILGKEQFTLWINQNISLQRLIRPPPTPPPTPSPAPIRNFPQPPPPPPDAVAKPNINKVSPGYVPEPPLTITVKVSLGKTYSIENGCTFEFADTQGILAQEIPAPPQAKSRTPEEQKFFSCFAHDDRELQARNNQRLKVKIAQLRQNCESGEANSCRSYSQFCFRNQNPAAFDALSQGKWPNQPCKEIDSLSR